MRAPFTGTVRRKALSVIVRGVSPPLPQVDDMVEVLFDGEWTKGRVRTRLGVDVFRVSLTRIDGSPW